jgi:hypothetical protein
VLGVLGAGGVAAGVVSVFLAVRHGRGVVPYRSILGYEVFPIAMLVTLVAMGLVGVLGVVRYVVVCFRGRDARLVGPGERTRDH